MAYDVKKPGVGRTRVSAKHQVTIPAAAFRQAGFAPGDVVRVEAQGAGRVVLTRVDELLDRYSGSLATGGALRHGVESHARRVVALLDSGAVAGLDRDDPLHRASDARVRELAARGRLVVSVITYAELLTGAALGHHDEAAVRGFFADLIDVIHVVDTTVTERASALRSARPALRLPDALILATGAVHDADVVVTADRRWIGVRPDLPPVELLDPAPR